MSSAQTRLSSAALRTKATVPAQGPPAAMKNGIIHAGDLSVDENRTNSLRVTRCTSYRQYIGNVSMTRWRSHSMRLERMLVILFRVKRGFPCSQILCIYFSQLENMYVAQHASPPYPSPPSSPAAMAAFTAVPRLSGL